MKYEREEERYRNSLSSVSTVLLNHYDTILDENGLEREATASEEDKKIYDTVRDITSKFELTTDDEKGITWGKDVEMNETRNLMDKFGGEDGLYFYRKIFKDVKKVIKDRALLGFEMGFDQREIMEKAVHEYFGDTPFEIIKDMNGKDRMLFIYHNLKDEH